MICFKTPQGTCRRWWWPRRRRGRRGWRCRPFLRVVPPPPSSGSSAWSFRTGFWEALDTPLAKTEERNEALKYKDRHVGLREGHYTCSEDTFHFIYQKELTCTPIQPKYESLYSNSPVWRQERHIQLWLIWPFSSDQLLSSPRTIGRSPSGLWRQRFLRLWLRAGIRRRRSRQPPGVPSGEDISVCQGATRY